MQDNKLGIFNLVITLLTVGVAVASLFYAREANEMARRELEIAFQGVNPFLQVESPDKIPMYGVGCQKTDGTTSNYSGYLFAETTLTITNRGGNGASLTAGQVELRKQVTDEELQQEESEGVSLLAPSPTPSLIPAQWYVKILESSTLQEVTLPVDIPAGTSRTYTLRAMGDLQDQTEYVLDRAYVKMREDGSVVVWRLSFGANERETWVNNLILPDTTFPADFSQQCNGWLSLRWP